MSGSDAAIDSGRFRHVLGHFPTGVTIITAPGEEPVGLTIGSFTSVSLDPPLVGFLPGKSSTTWPDIQRSGAFCVNILSEGQGELCWTFARETGDKFAGCSWSPGPVTGSPVLDGVIAWIDCSIHRVLDAGDHWFVLGLVRDLQIEHDELGPLLFNRGKLGGFRPGVSTVAAVVLGLVLLASGALKVAGWGGWRRQATSMGVPGLITVGVPVAELALGAMLVVGLLRSLAALLAGALLVGFTVWLVVVLASGRRPACACFGAFSRRPVGWGSVVRNVALVGLAAVVVMAT